jgi:uncharacterized protein (DUF3084 family)
MTDTPTRADTIEIALDPVTAGKKLLRELRRERATMQRELAAHAAVMTERETAVAAREAQCEQDRQEIEQERASLQRRRLNVEALEGRLDERHKYISDLEIKWRGLGEPASVQSGFQSPEFTALEKAKRAHAMAGGPAVRTDRHGTPFPADTSITRTITGDEGEAA